MLKAESGSRGSYSHNLKAAIASELVHFEGALVSNCVLGSSNEAIYRRFQKGSCFYSKEIDDVVALQEIIN